MYCCVLHSCVQPCVSESTEQRLGREQVRVPSPRATDRTFAVLLSNYHTQNSTALVLRVFLSRGMQYRALGLRCTWRADA